MCFSQKFQQSPVAANYLYYHYGRCITFLDHPAVVPRDLIAWRGGGGKPRLAALELTAAAGAELGLVFWMLFWCFEHP